MAMRRMRPPIAPAMTMVLEMPWGWVGGGMEVEVVLDVAVAAAAVFWSVRGCWVLDGEVFAGKGFSILGF